MNYIVDTHAFIWNESGDSKLSSSAFNIIQIPRLIKNVSFAVLLEIAIKVSIGKLELQTTFEELIKLSGYQLLNFQPIHALRLSQLPLHHRDPFDRIMIAQSLIEDFPIISNDLMFDSYGVKRIW